MSQTEQNIPQKPNRRKFLTYAGAAAAVIIVGGVAYYIGTSNRQTSTTTATSTLAPTTVTSTSTLAPTTVTTTTTSTTTKLAAPIDFWSPPWGDPTLQKNLINGYVAGYNQQTGNAATWEYLDWTTTFNREALIFEGGAAPDVAIGCFTSTYAPRSTATLGLMPLDDYVNTLLNQNDYAIDLTTADPGLDYYFPDSIAPGGHNWWAVPWFAETCASTYRKDIFEQNNITPPTTLDEQVEIGKKLTNPSGGVYAMGMGWGDPVSVCNNWSYTFLAMGGGDGKGGPYLEPDANGIYWNSTKMAINNDAAKASLQYWYDMVWTYNIVSPEVTSPTYNAESDFMAGKALWFTAPAWVGADINSSAPQLKGKFDAFMLVKDATTGLRGASIVYCPYYIYATTKYPDACVDFINYLNDPARELTIDLQYRLEPLKKSAITDPTFLADTYMKVFVDQINTGEVHAIPPGNPHSQALVASSTGPIYNMVMSVLSKTATIPEAIATCETAGNAILAQPV